MAASKSKMLEPKGAEQGKEDILIGGEPGMRTRGRNKVRRLYTWRRLGVLGQRRGW